MDDEERIAELVRTVRHTRKVLTEHADRLERMGLPDAHLIRTVVKELSRAGDRFLTDTQPLNDLPPAPEPEPFDPPPRPGTDPQGSE